jgi:hypothetical protein
MSTVDDHELLLCGKPAIYSIGIKNKTAFFLCEAHASYYQHNTEPGNSWIASELVLL